MKIGFALYISLETNKYSEIILNLKDELNSYFNTRFYGDDLLEISIGIVCVAPHFDQFFKVRPPKYIKGPKTYIKEGMQYHENKLFQYDVKLDFELLRNMPKQDVKKYLSNKIIESLSVFDKVKTKLKDFDFNEFNEDLKTFLAKYS